MNPIQLIINSVASRFGAAHTAELTRLLRQLVGDSRANRWLAWLARGGFLSELVWQAISSLRPGTFLAARRTLPAGLTAEAVNEAWEEVIDGFRLQIKNGTIVVAPPTTPVTFSEQAIGFLEDLFTVFLRVLMALWVGAAILMMAVFPVYFVLAGKTQRRGYRALAYLAAEAAEESRGWLDLANDVLVVSLVLVVCAIVWGLVAVQRNRARLALPVILIVGLLPFSAFATAIATGMTILWARLTHAPLPIILWLLPGLDRYAMLVIICVMVWAWILRSFFLLIDKGVDFPGMVAARFNIKIGNIPVEQVAYGIWNLALGFCAGFAGFVLGAARWPDAQQFRDFLLYGVGLVALSIIILTWGGVQSNPKVRKNISIAFVVIVVLATLYVWYKVRNPGVIGGVAQTGLEGLEGQRSTFDYLWGLVQSEWHRNLSLPKETNGGWKGLGRGVIDLLFGIFFTWLTFVCWGGLRSKHDHWIARILALPVFILAALAALASWSFLFTIIQGWKNAM